MPVSPSIRQQAVGEGAHGGTLVADVVEVGEFVKDQHVRDPVVPCQPPLRIHAFQEGWVGHESPGFVVDHPPVPTIRVHQR